MENMVCLIINRPVDFKSTIQDNSCIISKELEIWKIN